MYSCCSHIIMIEWLQIVHVNFIMHQDSAPETLLKSKSKQFLVIVFLNIADTVCMCVCVYVCVCVCVCVCKKEIVCTFSTD